MSCMYKDIFFTTSAVVGNNNISCEYFPEYFIEQSSKIFINKNCGNLC